METEFFSKAGEPDLIEPLKRFFGYEAFGLISGVGDKKKAEYGNLFISEIVVYLEEK